MSLPNKESAKETSIEPVVKRQRSLLPGLVPAISGGFSNTPLPSEMSSNFFYNNGSQLARPPVTNGHFLGQPRNDQSRTGHFPMRKFSNNHQPNSRHNSSDGSFPQVPKQISHKANLPNNCQVEKGVQSIPINSSAAKIGVIRPADQTSSVVESGNSVQPLSNTSAESKENSRNDEDPKMKAILDRCRITPRLLSYIENFDFPYANSASNYQKLLKIGQGTFGEVFKAKCKRTNQYVALKKILMENEKEGFPITALREIKMLQKVRHRNIIDLVEICTERTGKELFAFYLVFSFASHDLAGFLNAYQAKLKLVEIKTMMKHILEGLYRIHACNILHRDMKAANVLISHDGVLKLADFGLARLAIRSGGNTPCYTNRVVTLWYRPPELLLGTRNYGPSIDIWGAGCLMAELSMRVPLLQGDTEQKQLILISDVCGSINLANWAGCDKLPLYLFSMDLPQNLQRKIRSRLRGHLQDELALSLVDSMMSLNPELRPDAEKALDNNFFFKNPLPMDNIKELLSRLPSNMFEYTLGCGAHANRGRQQAQQQGRSAIPGRRPVIPYYPGQRINGHQ